MQVRWPTVASLRPVRSSHLLLSRRLVALARLLASHCLSLAPAWPARRRTGEFLSPHCVSQGCCLFCPSIVRIHQRIHSFRRYCLTAVPFLCPLLCLSFFFTQKIRLPASVPPRRLLIASVVMLRINANLLPRAAKEIEALAQRNVRITKGIMRCARVRGRPRVASRAYRASF